jgi:preprotein translocase subunit SecG
MSISQLNAADGPADSAVQNRLTVAGLVLTILFFAGSFALALNAQSGGGRRKSFSEAFGYLEVALVVGALLAISAIACLLACQQCVGTERTWYKSKRAWFIVSTIALFLALSQAMSAGLTELVFGVRDTYKAAFLAKTLAIAASVLWVSLLFVAPIHAMHSWWRHLSLGERLMVSAFYLVTVLFVLVTNATIYLVQDRAPETLQEFVEHVIRQVLQPMMWPEPWTIRPDSQAP